MGAFHFRIGPSNWEADDLVMNFHYSKRVPSNVQLVATLHEDGGLFGDRGRAVAAVYFCIPPTRWGEEVWELARLVRRDDVQLNLTPLIGQTCKHIKRNGLQDLLVSFADTLQGHHGGIYQAASWNYDGRRDPAMDGLVVDGEFVPGRSANSRWGTRSPDGVRQLLGHSHAVEGHWDAGKHLYWKALNLRGAQKAKALELRCEIYPDRDKQAEQVSAVTCDATRIESVVQSHGSAPISATDLDRLQYEYEERCAIKEHDGKMPREQAEREAYHEIYGSEVKQEKLF